MAKRDRRRRNRRAPVPEGGPGGSSAPEPTPESTVKQTRLYARAVLEGWPLTGEAKLKVANFLIDVVIDERKLLGTRERLSAARALIAADRLNLATLAVADSTDKQESVDEDLVLRAQQIREERARRLAGEAGGSS